MKKKTKIWIAVLAAVVAIVVALLLIGHKSDVAVVHADPCQEGSIENTVTATGEIQPVHKVTVGTQVSGQLEKVYVDYNSTVKKGQLLAELDKSLLLEQVKQSQAQLGTTQSNKQLAQKSFDRVKALYDQNAATLEEYEQAETSLEQAKNQYITAQSDYERARTNLKYAEIYSPIDGVILDKAVEEGQTVASSFSTPTLFTIAANLTDMQLEAKVDEADIGMVKEGQKVRFSVDAFPAETFIGVVRQIRLVATVTSNVVTYTVIIDADNSEGKLYPGMTANITILVEQEQGVLVPLEAVKYELTPDMEAFLVEQGYTVLHAAQEGTSVYCLEGNTLRQVHISTGSSDGVNAVVQQGLEPGIQVVRSISREKPSAESGEKGGVFKMGPPERKNR